MRRDPLLLVSLLPLLVAGAGCGGERAVDTRSLGAGVTSLASPELGRLDRPAVAFPHDRHTAALAKEGCVACHPGDAGGRPSLRFGRSGDAALTRDSLVELYHGKCMGCHAERARRGLASGPVTCGECHRRDSPTRSGRQVPRFDLALHSRHVAAAQQACERCHHVKAEGAQKKLVYRKGAEEACAVCHPQTAPRGHLSLEDAAHRSCIGCHLSQGQKTGPTTCAGCHAGAVPSGLARPAAVARLLRGQRDRLLLAAEGAPAGPVSFDHLGHERTGRFCTDCHHHSLAPCKSCHALNGAGDKGGGVSLAAAFHSTRSPRSCVGCHAQRAAAEKSCAGCHGAMARGSSRQSCTRCHAVPGGPASMPTPVLASLPASSESFPEKVAIRGLIADYGPSDLPHRKIVARLDAAVRQSRLAVALHGSAGVLCAGCHHHSPPGQRPPPCRSCHGPSNAPTTDRPDLKAAYHRQCLGCHAAMGLKQGCEDCHPKREELR